MKKLATLLIAALLIACGARAQDVSHTAYRILGTSTTITSGVTACFYSVAAPNVIVYSDTLFLCESDSTYHSISGGGGSPGGSNTQMQFNDSSSFGGSADLTYTKGSHTFATTSSAIFDFSAATISNVLFNSTGFTNGHLLSATVSGGTFYFADGGAKTIIASGTAALGTSLIASGACASAVTVSASGVATTDTISYTPNVDPTSVTGYGVSATGAVLSVYAYPTSGNVNFTVCNSSSGSITPSALTLNWAVPR